jgi:hypothetical protein
MAGNPNWVKGKSGNPHGRPESPEKCELRLALDKAKKENKRGLIEHCVQMAYKDSQMAIAIMKKILPDLSGDEGMKEIVRTFLIRSSEPK